MRGITVRLTALLMLCLVAGEALSAQTLADNSEGRTEVRGNETIQDSKINDPSAFRVGAPSSQNSVGKHSFDALVGSSRDELVMFQGKQTLYGSRPGGEWWGGIKKPDFGVGDDRAMFNWIEVSYRDGIRFHLPISAPAIYTPALIAGATTSDHLSAGEWRWYVQGDGNLVLYRVVDGTPCPRWAKTWIGSSYHDGNGDIDQATLSPPCN